MNSKKTPKQIRDSEIARRLPILHQPEQLKKIIMEHLKTSYFNVFSKDLQQKMKSPTVPVQAPIQTSQYSPSEAKQTKSRLLDPTKTPKVKESSVILQEDGRLSESRASRMTGASDFSYVGKGKEGELKKHKRFISVLPEIREVNKSMTNDSEAWMGLFKPNMKTRTSEEDRERENRKRMLFRRGLDEQVNQRKKEKEESVEEEKKEYELMMKQIQEEEEKEKEGLSKVYERKAIERKAREEEIEENKRRRKKEKQLEDSFTLESVFNEQQKPMISRREEGFLLRRRFGSVPRREEERSQMDQSGKSGLDKTLPQIRIEGRSHSVIEVKEGEEIKEIDRKQDSRGRKWINRTKRDEIDKEESTLKKVDSLYAKQQKEIKASKKRYQEENEHSKILEDSAEWEEKIGKEKKQQALDYADFWKRQIQEKFEERRRNNSFFNLLVSLRRKQE